MRSQQNKDNEKSTGEQIDQQVARLNPLEFLPAPAFICDRHGRVLHANAKAGGLFGEACTRGNFLHEFSHNKFSNVNGVVLDSVNTPIAQALKEGAPPQNGQFLILTAGKWQMYDLDIQIPKNTEGVVLGALTQFLTPQTQAVGDDTKSYARYLEQANRELVEARELSQKALSAKSEFLSNMSHEIRTPMNAVIGMAEVLWETELSEEQRKLLSVLMRGGKNLLAIINDILEYSRLESGQLPIERQEFDLAECVSANVELMKPLATAKALQIDTRVAKDLGIVCGDSKKLGQILTNLIGNAIKFTEKGRVEVVVAPYPDHPGEVLFTISDTGIGISTEKLGELFKRFSQADMSVTKTHGGTGLGLAISKQLVELLGGSIWVQSHEGEGTTFHFTVKLAPVSSEQATPKEVAAKPYEGADEDLRDLRILLAEDSEDNAFLIKNYLKNIGSVLEFASNGQEAIDKYEAGNYDLILMDMQMPVMDGYSATRWIRVLEKRTKKHVPIIALTAYALEDEVKKSLDAGCDAHLSKPISKRALLDAIAHQVASET